MAILGPRYIIKYHQHLDTIAIELSHPEVLYTVDVKKNGKRNEP